MRKMMVIIVAVLLTASVASAHTYWTRPVASGPGNWNDAANWSAGVPVADGSNGYAYTGNTNGLAEIQVTDAQYTGARLYHGYFTASVTAPVLRIMDGGSLTFPSGGALGNTMVGAGCPAYMIIEAGGTLTPYVKLVVTQDAGSAGGVLDVAGIVDLTVSPNISTRLVVAQNEGAIGTCNVLDGGVIKLKNFGTLSGIECKTSGALLNIEGTGKIICVGDQLTNANARIAEGRIAGNGVLGEVIAVYDSYTDETSMIASPTPAAQNLVPGDGADIPTAFPLTLSWTIPSAYDGNDVYVKVWLGTDPNALTAEPNYPPDYLSPVTLSPASGLNVTSVDIDASVADTYYWRVDLDVQADPNFLVLGKVQSFNTNDDLPPVVSIETPDTMTWSDEPVSVAATVTDDGTSTLTYGWTAVPDGISDPDLNIDFSPSASVEDPTVTITNTTGAMVPVTLTLTATDGTGSVEASITINVYNDACQMALVGLGEPHMPTDFNWDCITDLLDFNEIALRWLNETTVPTSPVPVP